MNVNANVLPRSGLIGSVAGHAADPSRSGFVSETHRWSPQDFATEQVRGLVRRIFLANPDDGVTQVVFSAAESGVNVGIICDRVGRALARETSAEIAILSQDSAPEEVSRAADLHDYSQSTNIRSWSAPMAVNLWRVPESGLRRRCPEPGTGRYWLWALAELRNHFEYVVIQGPPALSSETALLGQLADGIILVLEAHSTRRATARKIKETLEGTQSRILGTVLSQRTFPVPEHIYRRL